MKYILFLILFFITSCATVKNSDDSIVRPEKMDRQNKFIYTADETVKPKENVTPKGFTAWFLTTGSLSFLAFKFLKKREMI